MAQTFVAEVGTFTKGEVVSTEMYQTVDAQGWVSDHIVVKAVPVQS